MKEFFIAIFGLIMIVVLVLALNFLGLFSYSFFAPKYEAVRREVFINTPSYQLGKQQELSKIQREASGASTDDVRTLSNIWDHERPLK